MLWLAEKREIELFRVQRGNCSLFGLAAESLKICNFEVSFLNPSWFPHDTIKSALVTANEAGRRQNREKKTTLEAFPLENTKETVHNVLFSTHNQEVKRQQRHAGCFCTFGAAGWTHRCLINDLSSAEGKGEDLQPRPSGLLTQASASLPCI